MFQLKKSDVHEVYVKKALKSNTDTWNRSTKVPKEFHSQLSGRYPPTPINDRFPRYKHSHSPLSEAHSVGYLANGRRNLQAGGQDTAGTGGPLTIDLLKINLSVTTINYFSIFFNNTRTKDTKEQSKIISQISKQWMLTNPPRISLLQKIKEVATLRVSTIGLWITRF